MTLQNERQILAELDAVLAERRTASAEDSYVAELYRRGLNRILQKVGEEATEVILAAKDSTNANGQDALIGEVADLWFHTLVLLTEKGLSSTDVLGCLEQRFGTSGHEEKAARNVPST